MNSLDLTKMKAPIVFRPLKNTRYYKPKVRFQNGQFQLMFLKEEIKNGSPKEYIVKSSSHDLCYWTKPEYCDAKEYESQDCTNILSAVEFTEFYLKFSEGSGEYSGCIVLSISKDNEHWIHFDKDQATYPENGVYYEGDYYRAIPFGDYIQREPLPLENVYDIREFGAIADGKTVSTEAFHAAVNAAKNAGGGIILVTGGHYCVGTIYLYSNMTLFIDTDSALVASKNLDNYNDAFIACIDAENVTIRGGGKIIGNGEYFVHLPLKKPLMTPLAYTKLPPYLFDPMGYPVDTIRYAYRARIRYAEDRYAEGLPKINRPMYNVWFRGCKNVTITNIIIEDSLDWTLDIDYCSYVTIKDIVINGNRHVANTDGIDITCSSHINIDHCFISCADDGLCIKAPMKQGHDGINIQNDSLEMGPVEDVFITNCTVLSVMNGFKIGTETYFDIKNVTVENCKFLMPDIYPGGVSGISIESSDGSHVSEITIRNIEMQNICCPLFICLNMRNKFGFASEKDKSNRYYGGSIENIIIENIVAYNAEVPSIITGFEIIDENGRTEKRLRNINIKDMNVIYLDNDEVLDIHDSIHESVFDYPENNSFGDVPAYGLFIRHVDKLTLQDIDIKPRTCNTRECIYMENVTI
jgi:polygalacturonase